jgi:hypothetical protein
MEAVPHTALSSLKKLFLRFRVRRLLTGLFMIVVVGALLVFAERLTGFIFFMRMERKVSLLRELNDLANNDITSNNELSAMYYEIASELESYKIEPIFIPQIGAVSPTIGLHIPERVGKFVSGGFLGFIVALSGFAERRKESTQWRSVALGVWQLEYSPVCLGRLFLPFIIRGSTTWDIPVSRFWLSL